MSNLPYQKRGSDDFGSGALGSPRGSRPHLGVDYIVTPGQNVIAPFSFTITGISIPYTWTNLYTGFKGKTSEGYDVRIWYLIPNLSLIGKDVFKGEIIGEAQSLQNDYPGITDHIHVQVSMPGEFPSLGVVWNGKTYIEYV